MGAKKIYWGSGSPYAWRVLITLEEKALEYESVLLSFSKKEHKREQILALNPRGQVPVLTDGDVVLSESGASCVYLQATYSDSGARLMSSETVVRAETLQRMFESQNLVTAFRGAAKFNTPTRDEEELTRYWETVFVPELRIWEGYLTGKEFLVGGELSLADIFVFPFLGLIVRFGADLAKAGFPALAEYYARMSARKSVTKTIPPHWKDSEGPGILGRF